MKIQGGHTKGLAQLLVRSKHSLSSRHYSKSSVPSIGPVTLSETASNETNFTIGSLIRPRVELLQYLINVITK